MLVQSPLILGATIATWVLATVTFSTLRWRLLLRASGVTVAFPRAAALQSMGFFFNSVVPGNVGGDVMKNLYVLPGRGAHLFVIVIGERLIGLVALIWVGCLAVLASAPHLAGDGRLLPPCVALLVLTAGTCLLPWFISFLTRFVGSNSGVRWGVLRRPLESAVASLQVFGGKRAELRGAFFLSFAIHATNLVYFFLVARELGNPGADLARVALVYPLGMLTVVLPISLSGLGVGHIAFEQLFALVGLSGGANVFNVFIVGILVPSVLGAIPYLILKRG